MVSGLVTGLVWSLVRSGDKILPTQPQSYLINFLLLVTLHFRPVICSPPVTNSSISDVVNEAHAGKNPDDVLSSLVIKYKGAGGAGPNY